MPSSDLYKDQAHTRQTDTTCRQNIHTIKVKYKFFKKGIYKQKKLDTICAPNCHFQAPCFSFFFPFVLPPHPHHSPPPPVEVLWPPFGGRVCQGKICLQIALQGFPNGHFFPVSEVTEEEECCWETGQAEMWR